MKAAESNIILGSLLVALFALNLGQCVQWVNHGPAKARAEACRAVCDEKGGEAWPGAVNGRCACSVNGALEVQGF